jgi:WbqC-like protein family
MKLAIMQPYLFPYIGYFQLIKTVDIFVFYDDVNYIKKGWVNRNRILVNKKEFTFSVPLNKISQNITIRETYINLETFESWKEKIIQTLLYNYKKAPFFSEVNELINSILNKKYATISDLAIESIIATSEYLGFKTTFFTSSERYENRDLERQERLIDICNKENASDYINALGGNELYDKKSFKEKGIELSFIKTLPIEYKQFNNDFVPWLSIIDVLMFNSIEEVEEMLDKYELV